MVSEGICPFCFMTTSILSHTDRPNMSSPNASTCWHAFGPPPFTGHDHRLIRQRWSSATEKWPVPAHLQVLLQDADLVSTCRVHKQA